MKSNIMSKLFTIVVTVMAAVNIICGFFVVKGFYYLGPWLAWAGIFALICLFGSGILGAFKKSGLKRKLRDMLDDDYVKPDKKAVKKAEAAEKAKKEADKKAKATAKLTRAEYDAKMAELFKMYEDAIDANDTDLMQEIREEMADLKAMEPAKIDKTKELEELRKAMGV